MAENTQSSTPVALMEMTQYESPLHQSALNCWLSCKRKYLFQYRLGLAPRRPSLAPSATLGSLIHSILSLGLEQATLDHLSNLSTLEFIIREGGDEFGDIAKRHNMMEELWSKAKVVVTILQETYPPNPKHKVIFNEQYFQADVLLPHNRTLPIGGTLDRVIHNEEDDTYWIRDYKSTSRDVLFTLTGYRWSAQLWLYKLLFELTQSKPCRGFILDIIQTPSIKLSGEDRDFAMREITKGKNKGEMKKDYIGEPLFKNYLARCKQWYTDNKDSACRSFREMFPTNSYRTIPPDLYQQLQNYYTQTPDTICPDVWPRDMSGSACKSYQRVCDYYTLCNTCQQAWPILMASDYIVKPPATPTDATASDE